jgi:hypothetical protein
MGSGHRKKKDHNNEDEKKFPPTPLEIQFDRLIQAVDEEESLGDRTAEKRAARAEAAASAASGGEQGPLTSTTAEINLFAVRPFAQTYSFVGLSENKAEEEPNQEPAPTTNNESTPTPTPIDGPATVQDNGNEDNDDPQNRSAQVITLRRELEEGVEQEEEIIFEHIEDDDGEEDTRERQVKFIGLPEHPPELTTETWSRMIEDNLLVEPAADEPAADEVDEVGDDDEEYGAQEFQSYIVLGGAQDENNAAGRAEPIGEPIHFFEEEEEEESDDDSSAEPPPIPIEVAGKNDGDDSEYDTELEFDASDDSSAEPYKEQTNINADDLLDVGEEVKEVEVYEDDNDHPALAPWAALAAATASQGQNIHDEEQQQQQHDQLHEDGAGHGTSEVAEHAHGSNEHESSIEIDVEQANFSQYSLEEPVLSKKQPIPPPDIQQRNADGGKDESERSWMRLIPSLLCILLVAAAIVTPLLLVNRSDNKTTSNERPPWVPTQSPSSSPTSSPAIPSPATPALRPTQAPTSVPNRPKPVSPTLRPTQSPVSVTTQPPLTPEVPENSICEAAIGPLEPNGAATRGSIAMAGTDEVDRCGTVGTTGPGVWYYTIGTGGEMMAHTCQNTTFDSKITIFEGDCDKPLCIEANDNQCGSTGSLSAVSWQSVFQKRYQILVLGEPDFVGSGNFELALASRYNDECTTAFGPMPVSPDGSGSGVPGDTLSANPNEIPCNGQISNSPSVFYLVRGTGGTLTASICGSSDFPANIAVMTGACPDGLTCLDKTQDNSCTISWESVAFQDYYVMIDGQTEADVGTFELILTTSDVPSNDRCNQALGPLPLDGSTVTGITTGASFESDAPFCRSAVSAPGVWYSLIGNGNTLQASLCEGASYDTRLSIYEGTCDTDSLESLQCVDGNDDFCGPYSLVAWLSEAGKEYFILVHGYQQDVGEFKLSVLSIPDA